MSEIGRPLGYEHVHDGVMQATLAAGSRVLVSRDADADTSRLAVDVVFALLTADEQTTWIGSSIFVGKRRR